MKYKIVIAEDGWLESYYRKWFSWHCFNESETIEEARAACAWHAMSTRNRQTYEVFTL